MHYVVSVFTCTYIGDYTGADLRENTDIAWMILFVVAVSPVTACFKWYLCL
jgi:hypothetical protein